MTSSAVVIVGISPLRILHYYKFLGSYAKLQGEDPDDFGSWVLNTHKVDDQFIELDVDVRELYASYLDSVS